jgi:7-cyano-7-deazaguanine reductase
MKKLNTNRFSKLTLLKSSKTSFPDSPEKAALEVFENLYSERDYEITFDCPEFTSLCPVTGQPDFGDIIIKYVPDRLCIESKSLKLFLFSFRNSNTFHEEAVNIITDKISEACSPRWMEVSGKFRPRGGIAINVKVEKVKKGFRK